MAFIHLADSRRRDGSIYSGGRADGTGYAGQIKQYPVICALDIVEQAVTMRSRREDVVTDDPRRATCPDCEGRINV